MWAWICANKQHLVGSTGLLLDIVGAWLVAWEIVHVYRGDKFHGSHGIWGGDVQQFPPPSVKETDAYRAWERLKHKRMWAGLVCLTGGFVLQMAALWIG